MCFQHVIRSSLYDGFRQIFRDEAVYLVTDFKYFLFVHRHSPFQFLRKKYQPSNLTVGKVLSILNSSFLAMAAIPETIMIPISHNVHVIIIVYSAALILFAVSIAFGISCFPFSNYLPHIATFWFFHNFIPPFYDEKIISLQPSIFNCQCTTILFLFLSLPDLRCPVCIEHNGTSGTIPLIH